jgi:6-methylsalicylate decarboxylase
LLIVAPCAKCRQTTRNGGPMTDIAMQTGASGAQRRASINAERDRIDIHHHHAPPGIIAEVVARKTGQRALIEWTPEKSLEDMDKGGIATAMTSIAPPGVWFGDNLPARRLARECNDYAAGLARDFPGRFGMFAVLPLPDIDASLREIEYALDVLHADGIGLLTSYGNKWLGDRDFAPVMDELNRRKTVVYTHPTVCPCCKGLIAEVPDHLIEFATDTTRTIASLMLTGTAARCRDIRFIFSHAGGTMPYLTERITWWAGVHSEAAAQMPDGVIEQLRRFYYDTAFSANRYALSSLLQLVPVSQVLYGTDFPFRMAEDNLLGLIDYGFTSADLRRVTRENALALLPQLAQR